MKPTHLLAAAIITAVILACLAAPAAAFSGAGSGTEASPYIITTPAQLQEMANDLDAYYQLGNDLDLSSLGSSSSANALIGSASAPFTGTLDGNGYTVSNINRVILWIFGATIKNIKITDISVTATSSDYYGFKGNGFIRTGKLYDNGDSANTFSQVAVENIQLSITTSGTSGTGRLVDCQPSGIGAGLGDTVTNCYVLGGSIAGTRTSNYNGVTVGGIGAHSSVYDSYVKLDYLYANRGYSTYAYIGGIIGEGRFFSDVYLDSVVSLTPEFKGSLESYGRLIAPAAYDAIITNSYGLNPTVVSSTSITSGTLTDDNGANVDAATAATQAFYENTLGWDFDNIWYWDDTVNLPKLQVFIKSVPPTISAVTATPATGGQTTEYTLTATATTEEAGGISGYQWAYSTDSGSTWTDINGATTATYTWTPGQSISGTVNLKVVVTGADGGTADSYTEGFAPTITVITPPAISSITTSRPLQKVGGETTLTAIFADSETGNTYQWYYRVSGGSWQAIIGATEPVSTFTPAVTGTLDIKIIATNAYSESSELSTTLTVLPTYTPDTISETTPDISISAENKYQATKQFALTTDLFDLEYFTPNLAYLAQGNAVYYIDSAEQEVIPVTNKTGNTITAAYIGSATAVLTDSSGNTAVYDYSANDWQYIEQNSAAVLASTTTYAATISGTTLNLYNLNGNKVDDIESTLTNLAGNDAANTFAGYSGQTLTYYWITGNQLSSGSQTMAHTITDVHQVPGTENYVVSTTANTYIVSISSSGAYSQVMETDTADPLLHTQATTINVLIGVADPNEIYVVGSDGETDGTYVSGSTLTDASIAKSTGLYAIAGGADYQAYILGKSESSTWQLTQVISFGEGVDYSQISTTGTYAAVATGLKLYLLEAVDVDAGSYMLQGVIIGSSGNPYAGKLITINGDQIRTDTSGRFLYPVTPNTLYTIVADTTTTEYTATSAALQQIAIRLKPNPFAQSVSYSATYNEETGNFEMLYEDERDLTQQVTWTIRETGDNTIVHQVTVQPGQTATWPVPFDKVFTGYQISMDAERGSINVENVWMITPAGSQPINIPGLDDTGKNIIFGCVLMIIAGLFGVMFSTKGAIFVVLAAGIMTFLGLLTIPWEIIIVAGLLAVLAALAKGGGGQ